MTGVQHDRLIKKTTKELEEFKDYMLQKSSEEIYDSFYQIAVYEDLYSHLCNYGEDLDYKGFPKKDILDFFYRKFMKTGYDLQTDDLKDFFYYQIDENIRDKLFENMWGALCQQEV